jgi:Ni,Fe-hydrogenase I cytochrome b subunit
MFFFFFIIEKTYVALQKVLLTCTIITLYKIYKKKKKLRKLIKLRGETKTWWEQAGVWEGIK